MFEKWFRYFKHIYIWLQLGFRKGLALLHAQQRSLNDLASSMQLKKKFSWNSAFSRWASPESREKIHRNCIKKKMSITHGQLPHKNRKGQCPKINWTVPIMWYQSLQAHSMPVCHGCLQLNFILHFIFIVLSFSFKLWYDCILYQFRSYKTCLSWK